MISSITPTTSFLRQQQQQKTHRRARLAFLSAVAAAYTNAATAGQEACTTAESCRLRPAVMVPQHKPRSRHGPSTPRLGCASPQVRGRPLVVCSRTGWLCPPSSDAVALPPLPLKHAALHTRPTNANAQPPLVDL